jgi:hypothetical protein
MDRHGLTDADLIELANDDDFQAIIASDPELDRLEAEQYDEQKEFFALNWMLGLAPVAVGRLPILKPLTPAKLAFLWGIKNAYALGGTCTPKDADIFLFVLASDLRDLGCTVPELPAKAAGFAARAGLSFQAAHEEISFLIAVSFLPLQMLPRSKDNTPPRYDVEWLADLVSVVSKESGENASFIMHEMSLTAACAFVVSARKAVDTKHEVRRRVPTEIATEIMDRSYALGRAFLDKKRS